MIARRHLITCAVSLMESRDHFRKRWEEHRADPSPLLRRQYRVHPYFAHSKLQI